MSNGKWLASVLLGLVVGWIVSNILRPLIDDQVQLLEALNPAPKLNCPVIFIRSASDEAASGLEFADDRINGVFRMGHRARRAARAAFSRNNSPGHLAYGEREPKRENRTRALSNLLPTGVL